MRVAMLSTQPISTNGWGHYTRELVTALAAQGVKVDLITAVDAAEQPDLDVSGYHRVLPSLTPPKRFSSLRLLGSVPSVHRLIGEADVVHVVAEPYALAVPFVRNLFVTAHGTYLPRSATRPVVGSLYRAIF